MLNNEPKALVTFLSVLFSSNCVATTDSTLSPPSATKWINVEVQNPSRYTKPFPLEVRYISHKCLKKRISGVDGSVITEPSYNVINIPLQQGSGDLWKAKVAMTGGGSCEWTLSAFNLGIEYIDATHLGKDLVPGTAVGATIAFDDDASRNGKFTPVSGNLTLTSKYYPYIREKKLGRKENTLSLFGKENFQSLRAYNAKDVKFLPKLDESKIIKFIGLEKKEKDLYPKIIYPDGSVAPDRTLLPDFDKLEKMIIE